MEATLDVMHIRLLVQILNNVGSIEHELAARQLSLKDDKSKSWFIKVKGILQKYSLTSIYDMQQNPPSKKQSKELINQAIGDYWKLKWIEESSTQSSMRFLNLDQCGIGVPLPVWKSVHNNK